MKVKISTKSLHDHWVRKNGGRTTLPFCKYFLKVNDTEVILVEGLKWQTYMIGLIMSLVCLPFLIIFVIGKVAEWVIGAILDLKYARRIMRGVWEGGVRKDHLKRDEFMTFSNDVNMSEKDVQRVLNRVKTSPTNKE